MTIPDWPNDERPREKLLQKGPAALSDAELLAIFFRTGMAGCTAVDLARGVLSKFGSLFALLHVDAKSFCAERGLGLAKYAQLQAALELSRRCLHYGLQNNDVATEPTQLQEYIYTQLAHREEEIFVALFLDAQQRVLVYEELFSGTVDGAVVYPRVVVKRALQHNASSVIVAHNHPSGIAEPSLADRRITQTLHQALALVEIRLLDHLIVAKRGVTSLAEKGWVR